MWCIDNRCTDVFFNLAAEEYLLKRKSENFFMIWQSAPAVVLGKHQHVPSEVYLEANNIALARRFSGGGAVFQDLGNVNLTFIETVGRPDFSFYLQQVVDFLEELEVDACADARMGIYIDGYKVSGSAQCVHRNRVLYHCTLLFDTDLAMLEASLKGSGQQALLPGSLLAHAVPSVHSKVANISEFLPEEMPLKRFMRLLMHHFFESGQENRMYRFSEEEVQVINAEFYKGALNSKI